MRTGSPSPRGPHAAQLQGPISLERALFCLGCEAISTGASRCPQCTGETVWPVAEWLRSARPSPAGLPSRLRSLATESLVDQSPRASCPVRGTSHMDHGRAHVAVPPPQPSGAPSGSAACARRVASRTHRRSPRQTAAGRGCWGCAAQTPQGGLS